jgi:hypothetical protein
MISFRTAPTRRKYAKALKQFPMRDLYNQPSLKDFGLFILIDNDFPHDKIAKTNHLLLPKRRVNHISQLRWYEKLEFFRLLIKLNKQYDCIKYNFDSCQSVKHNVHWHLYKLKEKW